MALSDTEIKSELGKNIIIHPFNESHLSTSSYDVTLGEYYFRERKSRLIYFDSEDENEILDYKGDEEYSYSKLFNPFSEDSVRHVWGTPESAMKLSEFLINGRYQLSDFKNISPEEQIIILNPGETILAHTNEFIGGLNNITTMMKARSSYGRSFIEVCKCAGWGDVGYTNRWTMEITNISRYHAIPLVVGRKIAQIVFIRTGPIEGKSYSSTGKYQTGDNLQELIESWNPNSMTPKLYLDNSVRKI